MIDLSQYPKYQKDIQGKHTNIYPIVRIDETLHISTVKESIDGVQYFDYGLSVANIKESIDITTRNFKISNVTFSLNNYSDNENRLSDTIYNYINKKVEIFYKSQSCEVLNDCLPVYKGLLKDAKYNDKTITITLEDLTEQTLHKDVPIANLGYSENVFSDKYKNKYIPITYGKVEKAPAVLYKDGGDAEGRIHIISDNIFGINNNPVEIIGFNTEEINIENNLTGNINSHLYIYKDNYFRVLPEASSEGLGNDFEVRTQFQTSLDGNSLYIDKEFELDFPQNLPAENLLECMKVTFPNDVKLLKADETFNSSDGHVVSLVNSSVNSIEAIIDNPKTQNEFIIDEDNFLNTSAQIPNNELTVENSSNDTIIVHEFTPHFSSGIYYPSSGYSDLYNLSSGVDLTYGQPMNLQSNWEYIAWLWSSADLFPTGTIQFVEFPCADLIKGRLELELEPMNIILKSGAAHDFKLQTRISPLWELWESYNNYDMSLPSNANGSSWNDFSYNALNNHTFPASVYVFYTTGTSETSVPIFVGQYNSLSIGDTNINLDDFLFFNIFDDGSGKPFLFTLEECAVFSPTDRVYQNTDSERIWMKYKCEYNGVPIGYMNNYMSGNGATCINDEYWMPENNNIYQDNNCRPLDPFSNWGGDEIRTNELSQNNGKSWCMYFPQGINGSLTMLQEAAEGKPFDPTLNCTIKPNTFIPLRHRHTYWYNALYEQQTGSYAGSDFSMDYGLLDNPNELVLGSGSTTSTGEKLMLSLPFSDLSASDVYQGTEGSTRTYAYGKINCHFNPQGSESPNTVSQDTFKVILSATDIDGTKINFTEDNEYNTTLIEVPGGDPLNTPGAEVNWSSVSQELENSFTDTDELAFKIDNWRDPETFNSLALTYSLTGESLTNMTFQTNINAIGVMQFIVFEKALDDNFYVDTFGRANTASDVVLNEDSGYNFKYTNDITPSSDDNTNNKIIIEKPTDILYHFTEKELGAIEITDRDSWKSAREQTSIKLAFSVKDKINSKELFQEISKNCNIIPRFKNNGNLAFSSINKTYTSSDVIIKSDDIINFEIGHTPLNKIYTMVNVKYKKDYENNEYTKQTGYCDGYDFFGNGDGGYEGGYEYDYYNIDRENNILEFESEYIRDKQSAKELRDFLYLYHCNRHAIATVALPLKYSNLEIGDVVEFDKIVNNTKSFGEDYTSDNVTRNGQVIYPYFIVTSVAKSPKDIKIEAIQLHKLERTFTAGIGSLSRMSEIGVNFDPSIIEGVNPEDIPSLVSEYLNLDDWNILYDIILKEESASHKYITTEQKFNADVNGSGTINLNDLNTLSQLIGIDDVTSDEDNTEENIYNLLGDVDNNGVINVVDVVMVVNFIFGTEMMTQEQIEIADYNGDGTVNIVDITNMIEDIFGENSE